MKSYIKDCGKAIVIGLILSGCITLLTILISLLIGNAQFDKILQSVISALCIVGAIGLFVSAAFIWRKKVTISEEHSGQWRRHFAKINIAFLFLIVSIIILLVAGGTDYLRYQV